MNVDDFLNKITDINPEFIQQAEEYNPKTRFHFGKFKFGTIAACITFFVIGIVAVDATTDGLISHTVKNLFFEESIPETIIKHDAEPYGNQVVYYKNGVIAFADELGVAVYDMNSNNVVGSINLQEINCNHFNSQTISTKFSMDQDDSLWIYNIRDSKAEGNMYNFNVISTSNSTVLTPKKQIDSQSVDGKSLFKRLERQNSHVFRDAFETFEALGEAFTVKKDLKYSQCAYVFKDENQVETACILVENNVKQDKELRNLEVWFKNLATGELTKKDINKAAFVSSDKKEKEDTWLPEFSYLGHDEILATVCNHLIEKSKDKPDYFPKSIYIPTPVIHHVSEKNNMVTVYGSFWHGNYELYGTQLSALSGSENPGILTFERKNDTLTFVKEQYAGDGAYCYSDIKEFSKNIPGLDKKYFDIETCNKLKSKLLLDMVKMYEQKHNLGIKTIKDLGWDPEPLE